ncbi:hypothetical protein ABRZ04_04520 [Castellaniella ginsengisoli]|uniref:Uncharacterized protein n=1 Tax=Castellaniella ginsengisoli TaxID=546114 RepID=A0AB39D2V0_9BURK
MATIKIHAGDFPKGSAAAHFSVIVFPWAPGNGLSGETVHFNEIESLEIASEESVKKLGGTVGWGVVGGALLGPVGLLAGLLAGGRKSETTFVCKFKDGRKMLATTDSKTYTKMLASVF